MNFQLGEGYKKLIAPPNVEGSQWANMTSPNGSNPCTYLFVSTSESFEPQSGCATFPIFRTLIHKFSWLIASVSVIRAPVAMFTVCNSFCYYHFSLFLLRPAKSWITCAAIDQRKNQMECLLVLIEPPSITWFHAGSATPWWVRVNWLISSRLLRCRVAALGMLKHWLMLEAYSWHGVLNMQREHRPAAVVIDWRPHGEIPEVLLFNSRHTIAIWWTVASAVRNYTASRKD